MSPAELAPDAYHMSTHVLTIRDISGHRILFLWIYISMKSRVLSAVGGVATRQAAR